MIAHLYGQPRKHGVDPKAAATKGNSPENVNRLRPSDLKRVKFAKFHDGRISLAKLMGIIGGKFPKSLA